MRKTQLKDHLTEEQIQQRMNTAKSREQFQRWQALYLIKTKQMKAKEVGDLVGVSQRTVTPGVYYDTKQGGRGLILQGRGGRRRELMSYEQEAVLVEEQSKEGWWWQGA